MKPKFLSSVPLLAACAVATTIIGLAAFADSPTYETRGPVTGTSSAEVIFPDDPQTQLRLVTLIGSSDLAASVFSLRAGDYAINITTANTNLAATNIIVAQTNAIAISNDLIIVGNGFSNKTLTVWGSLGSTNIITTAAIGITQRVGDSVFHLSAATSLGIGASSNKTFTGDAIYVAPKGRPLRVLVNGTSYSSVDTASAHRD